MVARNLGIIVEGQPEIAHWCDKCLCMFMCEDGSVLKVKVVVMDGLTMAIPATLLLAAPSLLATTIINSAAPTATYTKSVLLRDAKTLCEVSGAVDSKTHTTTYKTCMDSDTQEME